VFALYRRKPKLLQGTAYWSVSPPTAAPRTCGRLRVGFDHDAEYLGFLGQRLYGLVSAVPPAVALCNDMAEFKTRTLVSLLADENLSLISIWSPTFLTALLDHFLTRPEEILGALDRHESRAPGNELNSSGQTWASAGGRPFSRRRGRNLQVISCWTHGASEIYAENLRRLSPRWRFKARGWWPRKPLSHCRFTRTRSRFWPSPRIFWSFRTQPAESLFGARSRGRKYLPRDRHDWWRTLPVSLGRLGRVTGFIGEAPCLRFVGREGNVSDPFGEKLQGAFVERVIRDALAHQGVRPRFFVLAPTQDGTSKTGYASFSILR